MSEAASAGSAVPDIRVAVVDDHRLLAEGLAALLARPDLEVLVVASSWTELIAHARMPVDVAVVDLHLGDDIDIATKVETLGERGVATVVVSRHEDRASVAAAMRAGAHAFIATSDSGNDLVAAVRAAAEGATHLADHRASALDLAADLPNPALGPKERRAIMLYASGRTLVEVARTMATTEETVKSYIKRARRKFRAVGVDVGTRPLLRDYAANVGWLNNG
jgi:DNA-binding NarL/FixJ family response regulator